MKVIRIIETPPGFDIPVEILNGWVGTVIPLSEGAWGVADDAFWVRVPVALEAVRRNSPRTAAYWEAQGPLCTVAKFVFPLTMVRFESH